MTNDTTNYFDRPGWSQSALKPGLPPYGTMAHIRAAIDSDDRPTRPMRMGSLVHAGIFEPMTMLDDYVVMPPFELDPGNVKADGSAPANPRSTKYYKARKAEWMAANEDKLDVTQGEYDAAKAMLVNLGLHSRATRYFASGKPEQVIEAKHEPTGLLMRGKADWIDHDNRQIVDLKTTREMGNAGRFIANWLIDFQLAYYRRIVQYNTGHAYGCRLVLVLNKPPYLVDAFDVCDMAIDAMDAQIDPLLARVAACEASGVWPGLDDQGDKVETVPSYHLPQTASVELTMGGKPLATEPKSTDEVIVF